MTLKGSRKLVLGLAYLACAPLMVWQTGTVEGVAAAMVALASGVGAIVWGNSREYMAGNGGRNE